MGTHANFFIINREMYHTAPEMKQEFTRIPVTLVLLDCIFNCLLGQVVFQLKGGKR